MVLVQIVRGIYYLLDDGCYFELVKTVIGSCLDHVEEFATLA